MDGKENSLNVITTRGGDGGYASLCSGERRGKDAPIFCFLGDLDELTSLLGLVRAHAGRDPGIVIGIQRLMIKVGALAAVTPEGKRKRPVDEITGEDRALVEREEEQLRSRIEISGEFILPGGSVVSGYIDLARSVARRCERSLAGIIRSEGRNDLELCLKLLNRLSDYLFILARAEDQEQRYEISYQGMQQR